MDQIEDSIKMSMSGVSFQPPTLGKANSSRQCVPETHQTSSNSKAIVVTGGNGGIPSHSSVSSKTAYLSSASTTPTDLMDVVTSGTYVGAY